MQSTFRSSSKKGGGEQGAPSVRGVQSGRGSSGNFQSPLIFPSSNMVTFKHVDTLKVSDYSSISYLKSAITQKVQVEHLYVGLTNDVQTRFQNAKPGTVHYKAKYVLFVELVFHGNTLEETRTDTLKELENHYLGCLNEIKSGYAAQDGNFVYHLYFIVG